jgi:hypothetical protein
MLSEQKFSYDKPKKKKGRAHLDFSRKKFV